MSLKSWLDSLRARCIGYSASAFRRDRADRARRAESINPLVQQVEPLEERALLSVSALLINGTLSVAASGADNITVRANSTTGKVEVLNNSTLVGTVPNVNASALTGLVVTGSDSPNAIDLSGITTARFPALTSLVVSGGDGNDRITGSPDIANSLNGGDGADTLTGSSTGDSLNGGNGADSIIGGLGNDSLFGGDGADSITGDDGNDTILAGNGNDTVDAGNGADNVEGNNGADSLLGNTGDDTINGDGGTDTIFGGDGNDSILGGEFNDSLFGEAGNDTIDAQAGDDIVDGGSGDDSLFGNSGNDSIIGNAGNDTLNGEAGNDTLSGDDGNDSLLGGSGSDSMNGSAGDDVLSGQGGSDSLVGGGGADNIDGGDGNDLVQSLATGIVVNDLAITEGDSGTFTVTFTVSLTSAGTQTVTVGYATSAGTASAGSDFQSVSGTLVFPAGVTSQLVSVSIVNDTSTEGAETFTLDLSNAVNAALIDNQGLATITDNDVPSGVSLTARANVNVSRLGGNQDESAIIVNPSNPQQLFAFANSGRGGMFAARSTDGGLTWGPSFGADFIIADGNDILPVACCDPTLAWDDFGNLFLVYIDDVTTNTHVAVSTDAGQTFSLVATLGNGTDQPTVTVGPGTGGIGSALWVTYDEGGIVMRGAPVMGLGMVGAFSSPQATGVGQFGDIAIGPNGQVTVTGQNNTTMFNQTDPDGLGPMPLGPVTNLAVNVDTFDAVTPQSRRTIDAEAGLVYDQSGGAFDGRLYLIYTEETPNESNNTEIFSRFSTNNGATWSTPVRVNDDATTRAQIFSKIAIDQTTGAIAAVWQDARNDSGNTLLETFASVSIDGGLTWSPNVRISGGQTNAEVGATGGQQLGDYIGLTFHAGQLHASWADNSNSTSNNPDGTRQEIDIYTARVTVTISTTSSGNGSFTASTPASSSDVGDSLTGSNGDDIIIGASGDDVINGALGNDVIFAGNGNDTVFGGTGNDTLLGEGGNDLLNGQGGNDSLDGGDGDDQYLWQGSGSGKDTVGGSSGFDTALVNGNGSSNVFVVGQDATNRLTVSEAGSQFVIDSSVVNVIVNGGSGDDTITIGNLAGVAASVLSINGGNGDDTLSAAGSSLGDVRLSLSGGIGLDSIIGSSGSDTIDGGDGNDTVLGGLGNDSIFGGAGVDRLNGEAGDDSIDGGDDNDGLNGGDGNDSLIGGSGDDSLRGGNGNDTASGGFGADTLNGEAGNDSLDGGSGTDTLTGGDGNDTLSGGAEADSITGDAGTDSIFGGDGDDTIDAGDGNDTVQAGDGNDVVNGGLGDDAINGGDGNDTINGGAGRDVLVGGDGNDVLVGGADIDTLLAGDGDDTLNGQGSTDVLATGEGTDVNNDASFVIDEQFVLSDVLMTALGL